MPVHVKKSVSILVVVLTGFLVFGFQNCSSGTSFTSGVGANSSTGLGNGSGGSGSGGGTAQSIRHFQPALAVRDMACISCHANIQATTITDFGYGSPWYMNSFASATDYGGQTHYTANTLQTLENISGQMIVPQTTIPASYINQQLASGATALTAAVNLSDYLQLTSLTNDWGSWYSYFKQTTPVTNAETANVVPSGSNAKVAAQPLVYIGAPTTDKILALIPGASSTSTFVHAVGAVNAGVSGLSIASGLSSQNYVINSGTVECAGEDVVINGTLILNNAVISGGNNGCRMYVTGSVFIIGPIQYAANDSTNNLQITSATSIMMGEGLNGSSVDSNNHALGSSGESPLHYRLLSDFRSNMLLRVASTSAAYKSYATGIFNEANNIGVNLLQDASVPGSLPTAKSAAGQVRATLDFQHILLNAPLIHSRYMGTVNGVIISESALFSLGEFAFNYDPIFETVPVLPALAYDVLCTTASCVPAN